MSNRLEYARRIGREAAQQTAAKVHAAISQDIIELYWNTNIPHAEILRAYGLPSVADLMKIAGPAPFDDLQCERCGRPVLIFSRRRVWERRHLKFFQPDQSVYPWVCHSCEAFVHPPKSPQPIEQAPSCRQQTLRQMPYREYLASPEWQAKRSAAFRRAAFRCQTCCEKGRLNVHHRTYARRGQELDSDLIVLCKDCHKLFHDNRKLAEGGLAQ